MTAAPDLRTEALAAQAAGLSVLPIRADGTKRPDGPWKAAQAAPAPAETVEAWFGADAPTRGLGVVCGAVSGHLELLELDWPRAGEDRAATWREFLARAEHVGAGELVERISAGYAEATPSGGLHLLYRCPDGVEGNLKLARRLATDAERQDDPNPHRVIFETRGEGGFVVVAPTNGRCHPTGRPWVRRSGGFTTIATITGDERAVLLEVARSFDELGEVEEAPRAAERATRTSEPGTSWMDATVAAFNAATTWAEILEPHGWRHAGDRGGVGYWTRPGKDPRDGHSATTNANGTDRFILWSSSVSVPGLEVATGAHAPSYDRFSVWAAYHHGGDRQAAAIEARKAGYGPEWREGGGVDPHELIGSTVRGGPATVQDHLDARSDLHLPEEFWAARPVLEVIRDAARYKLVSPDAVLGAVLTRVAAATPHTVELPGLVGGAVGLTFYAGLVGPPEAGKSAAAAVAAELLPVGPHVLDRLPVPSGEGMVDALFEMVEEEDEGGKRVKVKRQTRHAAIFHIDEGAVLADVGGRQGATLMPTLRTAYTHGTLGNVNASVERRRVLEGHKYVYGVSLGIQPELAGPLLGDVAAGTPQRFIWLMATDPTAGDHPGAWPDRDLWAPPNVGALEEIVASRRGWRRHVLVVDEEIRAEVRAHRIAVMRGEVVVDGADAHQLLVRLKAAALLALLDERLTVEPSDWILAGVLVDTSRRVRLAMEAALTSVARREEAARVARLVRQHTALEETAENRALASAAKSVARVVVRHRSDEDIPGRSHGPTDGCTTRCIRAALGSARLKVITADDAIEEATAKGWVHPRDGRLHPGESRPA